jgi:quinol monooxygenase YgiN
VPWVTPFKNKGGFLAMIVVGAIIKTVEGKGDIFEKEFRKLAPKVRQDPGAIAYTLNRDIKDPSKFFFYEKYESDEALKYHRSTAHFKEFFQTMGPIMVGKPEVTLYQEIV